jgi:hypothetical protein
LIFQLFDYVNLAATLNSQGRYNEAVEACRMGLEVGRDLPRLLAQLGRATLGLEQTSGAIEACEAALRLDPVCLEAHLELAFAQRLAGDRAGALAVARRALTIDPQSEHAHCVLATLLLWDGATSEGLVEQEWHWRRESELLERRFGAERRWSGDAAPELRLLVAHEQGYGDLFHTARYFRPVRERVGRLILACAPDVAELMRSVDGVDEVVDVDEPLETDRFDAYVRLMSVPAMFDAHAFAERIPYIDADSQRVHGWEETLGGADMPRVGFAWHGNPAHTNDRDRSLPEEVLDTLADVPGITWHCLHKGPALETFSETAALVASLDLVVSVDTAVAHLAAAMDKPVWLLLGARPDWRWMLEGDRTAWYPSMRLFRRRFGGRWDTVLDLVRAELAACRAP